MQGFGQSSNFGGQATQSSGLFGVQPQQQQQQQSMQQPMGGGGFGGQAQPIGGSGIFGQPQASSGLFGQSQPPQQQSQSGFGNPALFGQQAQPQTASGGGFFGAGAQQPQTSGFGGVATQQPGGFGTQAQSSGFGVQSSTGIFGQQNSTQFGQQPTQAPTGFQTGVSINVLGGTSQGFGNVSAFGGLSGAKPSGFNNQIPSIQEPVASKMIYSEPQYYPQQILSSGKAFNQRAILHEGNQMTFQTIKSEPEFERASIQMLRLADLLMAKGQPSVNYEFTASQEFNQQPQKYPLPDQLRKLVEQTTSTRTVTQTGASGFASSQLGGAQGFQQQQNQSAWGGIQASTGLQTVGGWGAQPAQQNTGFGQQIQQPGLGSGQFMQNQGQGTPVGSGLFGNPQVIGNTYGAQPLQNQSPGGGLFSQKQQSTPLTTSGGLFGQTSQTSQYNPQFQGQQSTPVPQTGGIFGALQQQSVQQTPGGGLFGQTSQPTQGGLFGTKPQTPNIQVNVSGGGLFGGQSQAATSGLFGGQPQQQTASVGLFGATQQQPQPAQQTLGGGLFGQTAQPTQGGLFGTQQQQVGGGLFGGQPTPTPQPATGLFGAQPQQLQQPGLFNQKSQGGGMFSQQPSQQPLGGLFNQQPQGLFASNSMQSSMMQQQQQNNSAAPSAYVDLYSSKDPLGLSNSFIAKDHPMESIQKEIEELKKKIDSQYGINKAKSDETSKRDTDSMQTGDFSVSINIGVGQPQFKKHSSSTVFEDEANRIRLKEQVKYEIMIRQQEQARKELSSSHSTGLYKKDSNFLSSSTSSQSIKPDLSRRKNQLLATSSVESAINKETFKILCAFKYEGTEYNYSFDIHKSRDTSDLSKRVIQWLKTEFQFDGEDSEVQLRFNGEVLQRGKSLNDVNIYENATIEVRIPSLEPTEIIESAPVEAKPKIECELIPEKPKNELAPKRPKEGYKCVPSFAEIDKMTAHQLQKINNFQISNQFGSVQFLGETDITEVDLADVVSINQGVCEVYDDERHKNTKPVVGQKLNRPAIITLENMKPGVNQTPSDKERRLKSILENNDDAEHLSYDSVKFQWQFKVYHFTKWGDVEDEQMEDSVDQKPAEAPERSAFEEQSELIEDSRQSQQIDVEMKAGITPTLFKSFDAQFQQKNLKQRKLPQLNEEQIPKQTMLPSFIESLRPPPVQRNQEVNGSASQILATIKQRKEVFSKFQPLETQKPDNLATFDYITKDLGFKNLNKSSLVRRGAIRPCFHPSGTGIIKVEGNKISLYRIPEVKPFSLLSLFESTVEVPPSNISIDLAFHNLSIQSVSVDHPMESVHQICKTQFTDEFFRKMLENPLQEATLFNGRNSIRNFLSLAASHYASKLTHYTSELAPTNSRMMHNQSQSDIKNAEEKIVSMRIQSQKLNQEFNVICMLNALFGNPNVHLVELHHAFKGPKNMDKAKKLSTDVAEDSIIMVKKRRNAVTEVVKFVCGQKFPVNASQNQLDSQVYKTALQLLEIGDLRGCVKFLNKNKKTKVSLAVSQSVSNTAAMEVLRFTLQGSDKAQNGLSNMFDYVTGESQVQNGWERSFLRALMYEKSHTEPLAAIVAHFEQQNKNVDSLLWKILLVYARVKNAEEALWEMRGANLLGGHDFRDFRIRWLTLLVLRKALAENQMERQKRQDDKWSPHIPDQVLCDFSVRYVYQLLAQKNISKEESRTEACIVAYLIPIAKYRKRVILEILMSKSDNLDCKVHLPDEYLKTARALKFESQKQSSKAIDTWIKVGNHTQAELILRNEYLPFHLQFDSDFKTSLKFYGPASSSLISQSEQKVTRTQSGAVDAFIDLIKQKYPSSYDWEQTICGLYKKTQLLVKMMTFEKPNFKVIRDELNDILAKVEQQEAKSLVVEWIRIQLAEVAAMLPQKSVDSLQDSHTSIDGLPSDQAHRLCSWVLQSGLVQLVSNAE